MITRTAWLLKQRRWQASTTRRRHAARCSARADLLALRRAKNTDPCKHHADEWVMQRSKIREILSGQRYWKKLPGGRRPKQQTASRSLRLALQRAQAWRVAAGLEYPF